MKYSNIREEALKNKIAIDFFGKFDCSEIIKDIDFAVKLRFPVCDINAEDVFLMWAEAKKGSQDTVAMLTQLTLTIGKARTFEKMLPPPFIGCFDYEKIVFIPYAGIQEIFYQNDFNWKVAPSNHETGEFKQVYAQIEKILVNKVPWETYVFNFEKDEKELKLFIRDNFIIGKTESSKIRIDKNNFITIYSKWLETVKPTIQISDWEKAKKLGILDGDFYLADLLSHDNKTLKDKLYVMLCSGHYELDRKISPIGTLEFMQTGFIDNQKAHTQFWSKYERPPLEDYWNYITERRDLLAPQDVRERKGSFFTPQIWVELSQRYISEALGNDWQDDYYVWDCAAGTGNLLAGLTNKYNIWASTLDKADVDVMKDRILNGANLLESHVFQFDFLNDDFTKLPKGLQEIINDPKVRKKLIVYINPPYVEAGSTVRRTAKTGVSNETMIHKNFCANIGSYAKREIFVQFFIRVYREMNGCRLAEFSTLKILQAPYFSTFRKFFQADLEKMFVCPADTFDNVTGQFPIGFLIWNTDKTVKFESFDADVYNREGKFLHKKPFVSYDGVKFINDWLRPYWVDTDRTIGYMACNSNDFQHQNEIVIQSVVNNETSTFYKPVTMDNLIMSCIYFAVRKVIPANWLNDRDQFVYPDNRWKDDEDFQNDCLAYTLFNNNIQSKCGINHWIPFTEKEVDAMDKFDSHFMISFISGKVIKNRYTSLFEQEEDVLIKKRDFSDTAQNVFLAGRQLWQYYHTVISSPTGGGRVGVVNASLHDIRDYFQGRNHQGKMNSKSEDETYNVLMENLRSSLRTLANKIAPKVYEYGFLIRMHAAQEIIDAEVCH